MLFILVNLDRLSEMDVVSPRQLSCVTAIHDGNDLNCVMSKSKTYKVIDPKWVPSNLGWN